MLGHFLEHHAEIAVHLLLLVEVPSCSEILDSILHHHWKVFFSNHWLLLLEGMDCGRGRWEGGRKVRVSLLRGQVSDPRQGLGSFVRQAKNINMTKTIRLLGPLPKQQVCESRRVDLLRLVLARRILLRRILAKLLERGFRLGGHSRHIRELLLEQ